VKQPLQPGLGFQLIGQVKGETACIPLPLTVIIDNFPNVIVDAFAKGNVTQDRRLRRIARHHVEPMSQVFRLELRG
jgi:hypothetical protein